VGKRVMLLAGFIASVTLVCLAETAWAQGVLVTAEQWLGEGSRDVEGARRSVFNTSRPSPFGPTTTTGSLLTSRRPIIPPSLINRLPPSHRPLPFLGWPAFPISLR